MVATTMTVTTAAAILLLLLLQHADAKAFPGEDGNKINYLMKCSEKPKIIIMLVTQI